MYYIGDRHYMVGDPFWIWMPLLVTSWRPSYLRARSSGTKPTHSNSHFPSTQPTPTYDQNPLHSTHINNLQSRTYSIIPTPTNPISRCIRSVSIYSPHSIWSTQTHEMSSQQTNTNGKEKIHIGP